MVFFFQPTQSISYCSWWQHAANLASYEQQDAHEFFISILEGIHEKVDKDRRKPYSQGKFLLSDILLGFRSFSNNVHVVFTFSFFFPLCPLLFFPVFFFALVAVWKSNSRINHIQFRRKICSILGR